MKRSILSFLFVAFVLAVLVRSTPSEWTGLQQQYGNHYLASGQIFSFTASGYNDVTIITTIQDYYLVVSTYGYPKMNITIPAPSAGQKYSYHTVRDFYISASPVLYFSQQSANGTVLAQGSYTLPYAYSGYTAVTLLVQNSGAVLAVTPRPDLGLQFAVNWTIANQIFSSPTVEALVSSYSTVGYIYNATAPSYSLSLPVGTPIAIAVYQFFVDPNTMAQTVAVIPPAFTSGFQTAPWWSSAYSPNVCDHGKLYVSGSFALNDYYVVFASSSDGGSAQLWCGAPPTLDLIECELPRAHNYELTRGKEVSVTSVQVSNVVIPGPSAPVLVGQFCRALDAVPLWGWIVTGSGAVLVLLFITLVAIFICVCCCCECKRKRKAPRSMSSYGSSGERVSLLAPDGQPANVSIQPEDSNHRRNLHDDEEDDRIRVAPSVILQCILLCPLLFISIAVLVLGVVFGEWQLNVLMLVSGILGIIASLSGLVVLIVFSVSRKDSVTPTAVNMLRSLWPVLALVAFSSIAMNLTHYRYAHGGFIVHTWNGGVAPFVLSIVASVFWAAVLLLGVFISAEPDCVPTPNRFASAGLCVILVVLSIVAMSLEARDRVGVRAPWPYSSIRTSAITAGFGLSGTILGIVLPLPLALLVQLRVWGGASTGNAILRGIWLTFALLSLFFLALALGFFLSFGPYSYSVPHLWRADESFLFIVSSVIILNVVYHFGRWPVMNLNFQIARANMDA